MAKKLRGAALCSKRCKGKKAFKTCRRKCLRGLKKGKK